MSKSKGIVHGRNVNLKPGLATDWPVDKQEKKILIKHSFYLYHHKNVQKALHFIGDIHKRYVLLESLVPQIYLLHMSATRWNAIDRSRHLFRLTYSTSGLFCRFAFAGAGIFYCIKCHSMCTAISGVLTVLYPCDQVEGAPREEQRTTQCIGFALQTTHCNSIDLIRGFSCVESMALMKSFFPNFFSGV